MVCKYELSSCVDEHTHATCACMQDLDVCVQLAVAYFAYLRWAVTVPGGGGYTAPTGPAALPPHGPWPPSSILTLRPGAERNTVPLVTPLCREGEMGYFFT